MSDFSSSLLLRSKGSRAAGMFFIFYGLARDGVDVFFSFCINPLVALAQSGQPGASEKMIPATKSG